MKIASFTMMRNEAAILDPFMDQLSTFCDYATLVDHESADRSAAIVEERQDPTFALYHLKAAGYPQPRIATLMMERIFRETDTDWLLFLDCDEFLPFATRAELEAALERHGADGYCFLSLRNVVPVGLDGGDIFAGAFKVAGRPSPHRKVMVSRALFEAHPGLRVTQSCEGCASANPLPQAAELSSRGLYHIPVTSPLRFAAKIKTYAEALLDDPIAVAQGARQHWINFHRDLAIKPIDSFDFHGVGLAYPAAAGAGAGLDEAETLAFDFPYVRTPYAETASDPLMLLYRDGLARPASAAFVLQDQTGAIVASRGGGLSDDGVAPQDGGPAFGGFVLDAMSAGQVYADLVEPLFALPDTMPVTAWHGHIPFLMMLIKAMKPRSYVELGTHLGASMIAAATAAKSHAVPMKIYAIDSWEGDVHAGVYEGDAIYRDLKAYVDGAFRNVELVRSYFDDANPNFAAGSIDILHIDGLHTYEAVRHDFLTWLPKMAPDGVIMFHDTCVFERGFGVHQLWDEVRDRFTTFSFGHCHGLGVVFLDPSSPRVAPLARIAANKDTAQFYTALVGQVGGLVHQRMSHLDLHHHGRGSEQAAWAELAAARAALSAQEAGERLLASQCRSLEAERDAYKTRIKELSVELQFYRQQHRIASGGTGS